MCSASEPEPGSVIPCAPMRSPDTIPGRYARCCAGVPNVTSGSSTLHICALREKRSPLSWHPYPRASMTRAVVRTSASAPPSSAGTGRPWTPNLAHFRHASRGNSPASSRFTRSWLSSRRAKAAAASVSSRCSALSAKSTPRPWPSASSQPGAGPPVSGSFAMSGQAPWPASPWYGTAPQQDPL